MAKDRMHEQVNILAREKSFAFFVMIDGIKRRSQSKYQLNYKAIQLGKFRASVI